MGNAPAGHGPSADSRRDFLIGAGASAALVGLTGLSAYLSSSPHDPRLADISGLRERGLRILQTIPLRAETPLDLLDAPVTPADAHFVQGAPPADWQPANAWAIAVDGLVRRPVAFEAGAVPAGFPVVSRPLLLECGSNGCASFGSAAGPGYMHGGVGNALWTGTPVRHVLQAAGIAPGAAGLQAEARDGSLGPVVPLAKALHEATLLTFAMGGAPLSAQHGGPLRLVVPGWPEAYSRKWVVRLRLVPERGIEAPLTVKSLVTAPLDGARLARFGVARGAAWAGDRRIARVEVSTDFGRTWSLAALDHPERSRSWTRWRAMLAFAGPGYHEVWARATDEKGAVQPLLPDPRSRRNNAVHRVWVTVA